MAFLYDVLIDADQSLKKRENAGHNYYNGLCEHARRIQDFHADKSAQNVKVLDFGMGWGHWCFAAKAYGYSIWGAELSMKRIEYAQQHGVNIIQDLRQSDDLFNFIYSDNVFEHLDHPYDIAKMLSNRLAERGVLHIQVPDGRFYKKKLSEHSWQADKDALHPLEHINCFTQTTLTTLMKRVGLRPITFNDVHSKLGKLKYLRRKVSNEANSFYFIKSS